MIIAAVLLGAAAMAYCGDAVNEILPSGIVRWRMTGLLVGAVLFLAGVAAWRVSPAWDAAIAVRLQLAADNQAAGFFRWMTMVGGAAVMIPLALAAMAALGVAGRFRALTWLLLTVAGGRLTIEAMKYLVGRVRPPVEGRLVDVVTASFPSSHSAGTALTILALLAVFRCDRTLWGASFAFIIAIGLSRIMLGVHWPSDVLAGWGFGIFWVSACFSEKFLSGGVVSFSRSLRSRD